MHSLAISSAARADVSCGCALGQKDIKVLGATGSSRWCLARPLGWFWQGLQTGGGHLQTGTDRGEAGQAGDTSTTTTTPLASLPSTGRDELTVHLQGPGFRSSGDRGQLPWHYLLMTGWVTTEEACSLDL